MKDSPVLKIAAQLSEGYLNQWLDAWRRRAHYVLFNGNDAHFLSKVDQKASVEDIVRSPVAIDIGGNKLVLSLETL